ncbi:MAG: hypothetical protein KKB31_02705 [Nanoarchaeota archaeon]|nr:hypothetical protein [Nanoarchaeota archaeon]
MKSENLIHVKLDYDEARRSRIDLLSTQAALIRIAQAAKKYKELRSKEFELKIRLEKNLGELRTNLRLMKTFLPTPVLPKILEEKEKKEPVIHHMKVRPKEKKKKLPKLEKKEEPKRDSLDSQLKDIQEQLARLQ